MEKGNALQYVKSNDSVNRIKLVSNRRFIIFKERNLAEHLRLSRLLESQKVYRFCIHLIRLFSMDSLNQ